MVSHRVTKDAACGLAFPGVFTGLGTKVTEVLAPPEPDSTAACENTAKYNVFTNNSFLLYESEAFKIFRETPGYWITS